MRLDSAATLRANLDALAPAMRHAIESADASFVQVHDAGEQTSASVMTPDGRRVRIHSREPTAEADRMVDSAFPDGPTAVAVVIGAGLGHIVEAVERRAAGTKVIAIEPFPALARAMLERRDWREWIASGHLNILLGPDYLGIAEAGRLLGEQTVAVIDHPVLTREFPSEAARARDVAARIITGAQSNAAARKQFAGRYLLNTLRNSRAIVTEGDVSSLYGLFPAIPAIVVAAGPSLDARLQQVRELQDRALIVAVDTTLRPLLAAGIRPHLVVAVDPSELNAMHLRGIPDTSGSWLVSEGSIDSRVFAEFPGRLFTFRVSNHHPWPWLREQGSDRGTLQAWGSVLTTAFDLACEMGCDPIVFVGADLAYTGGVAHCQGTIFDSQTRHMTSDVERAEAFAAWRRHSGIATCTEVDIRGAEVLSTPSFVQFRDWLIARSSAVGKRRVLNATGNGILHGGGIVQADLELLGLPHLASGVDLRERIASAWRDASDTRSRAWAHMKQAYMSPAGRVLPMEAWLQFAGDTTSAEQIATVVDHALREIPTISSIALVADKAAPQPVETTITWTATAAGGKAPHQYKWFVHGGAAWTAVTDWSAASTFAWTPGVSGPWKVRVLVRSATGKVDEGEAAAEAEFVISGVTEVRLSSRGTTLETLETVVTWRATAVGGAAPYQYKWLNYDGRTWTEATDWTAVNTFTEILPRLADPNSQIGVWVRSAGNLADLAEAISASKFAIKGVSEVSLSSDKTSPQEPGATITWTATPGPGGKAPYQYKWFIFDGASWAMAADWSTAETFQWIPPAVNPRWMVSVWVRSAGSVIDARETSAVVPFPIQ